ncbi:aerobactin synthase IucC [Erwiniaceae bacterium BAC15a-03b]|uniref:Aerobactin synthase IucC n=1 Tax=Winslowiella arboricola TaxID=2978220 RepID=A0A9J6PUW2_9GAMM|nr:aerobactin synthase IucC [Winslowiella arboricola]MCU5775320.1 aerobactin synthase IucC [Winslowiella arboricola]MCU5780283.1 aerobactin synthase IucC [Winslowiella arboricola]
MRFQHPHWQRVNRLMVARIIAELEYEQVLRAVPDGGGWQLKLADCIYRFQATRGIWGWLLIDAATLQRGDARPVMADKALRQLGVVLAMNDAQLAEHLEDLYATLRADLQLLQARAGMSAHDLIRLSADTLQCLMAGHPKFIFNKGRRGWGLEALHRYAPEYQGQFQLMWLAVQRDHFVWQADEPCRIDRLLNAAMADEERQRFDRQWQALGLDNRWLPLPVHPWQWQQKIAMHFLPLLAEGILVEVGSFGDSWLAQQSLRTLTNASRQRGYDIKLPLTIYNTSCYRGIPGKYIAAGPAASRWLQQQFASDKTLLASGAQILGEPAAGYLAHPLYSQLAHAPYRYQEMLGVIWREHPSQYLQPGEQALLMAALMESDNQGNPLIGAWIADSGVTAEAWLSQLFRCVVIPLYHLMCRYGVSLIAHGQNITLVIKDSLPQRVLLKDFQGDMRLIDEDFPEAATLPPSVKAVTARLSADYLIHDLQTGHFVTVLRFISPLTCRLGVSEIRFWQLLGAVLQQYMAAHPQLAARFAQFDLFKPEIIRVVLNPVKLTYSEQDGGSRMLPAYRQDLCNPLYLAIQEVMQ